MTTNNDTRSLDKSATDDDAQSSTTRRTFLGAAAAVAGLSATSSTATATPDAEAVTDYYPEEYEFDERQAARGAAVLPNRTPVPEQVADYWGVDVSNLMTVAMADRFLGDDPDDDLHMAAGVSKELHALAETVMENAVDAHEDR